MIEFEQEVLNVIKDGGFEIVLAETRLRFQAQELKHERLLEGPILAGGFDLVEATLIGILHAEQEDVVGPTEGEGACHCTHFACLIWLSQLHSFERLSHPLVASPDGFPPRLAVRLSTDEASKDSQFTHELIDG